MTLERPPHIRWFVPDDLPNVLEVEDYNDPAPWSPDRFHDARRSVSQIIVVAEIEETLLGFCVYDFVKDKRRPRQEVIEIDNLCVHPDYRRQGVASAFITSLKTKLYRRRREQILVKVRDGNLPAHLFLAAQGFRAIDVVPRYYSETGDDGYIFHFHVSQLQEQEAAA